MSVNFTQSDKSINFDTKNPIIGDTVSGTSKAINIETRGKTRIYFLDANWPLVRRLSLTFVDFLDDDKDNFLELLKETIGLPVSYTDRFGVTNDYLILTPFNKVIQIGRACTDEEETEGRYNVTFEMEKI